MMKDDCARAGIPMLPVVSSLETTKRQILVYTLALVVLSASLSTTSVVGWTYLLGASALGVGFVFGAIRLLRSEGIEGAKGLYFYSLAYLAALFLAAMADVAAGNFISS